MIPNPPFKDPCGPDILLVQPVIRHPADADLHNTAFNWYSHYMKLLAEEMGFFSLVTSGVPSPPAHILSLAAYLRGQDLSVSVADLITAPSVPIAPRNI
ncbi:MAG: hypothetical protein JJV98_10505 [Desulfosarcina sp.]|nr:hypothetical protein [Desulfobacterales bacterium]